VFAQAPDNLAPTVLHVLVSVGMSSLKKRAVGIDQ